MEIEIFRDGNAYVVRWTIRGVYINVPTMEDAQDLAIKLVFKYEGIE